MGVSALREALNQLVAEKFVVSERNRGFRVAPLSLADLRDVNRSRILIETEALRLSIKAGDTTWEGHIVSTLHQLLRQPHYTMSAPGSADALNWERHHHAFHAALLAACPSPWMLHFAELLNPHYQRYRHYIWRHFGFEAVARAREVVNEEHQAIAALVLDRKADEAVEALRSHYQGNMETLIGICADRPGFLEV